MHAGLRAATHHTQSQLPQAWWQPLLAVVVPLQLVLEPVNQFACHRLLGHTFTRPVAHSGTYVPCVVFGTRAENVVTTLKGGLISKVFRCLLFHHHQRSLDNSPLWVAAYSAV